MKKHMEEYWSVVINRNDKVEFSRWGSGGSHAALCQNKSTAIRRAKEMPQEWNPKPVRVMVVEVDE